MDPALDEAKEWRQLALDRLGGIGPSAHPRPLRMHTETLRRDCPVSSSVALTPLVLLESKQHAVIGEPANRITCAAFTPDGQYVVSGSASGELCLWSLATGKVSRRFTGLPSSARAVAVSGDGRFVAASAGKENNGSVKIWGIASTEEVLRISASAEALEFCDADRALYVRDGEVARAIDLMSLKNRVANGAPATRPSADAVPAMRLWPESVLSLRKHSATTALSPNGLIAACAEGTNVEFWDLQAGQPWHRLKGDESTLAAMVFSPDGRALLSIGENGTLRLWQLPDWLPRLRNAIEHLKQAGQQYSPASLLLRQSSRR
jgi:WD40 repeat protein